MRYIYIILLLSTTIHLQGQVWTPINKPNYRTDEAVNAEKAHYYRLNHKALSQILADAPIEDLSRTYRSSHTVTLPMDDGEMVEFAVVESSVMQSQLQKKYSHIRSYKGYALKDPSMNVRMDINDEQFHAAIHSPEKIVYIDPQSVGYIAYDVNSAEYDIDPNIPMCGVTPDQERLHASKIKTRNIAETSTNVPLRTYRTAISCTGEFGASKGNKDNVMKTMVTGVNRMNQIFENELAMRLILVDGMDALFFFDAATDPFTNGRSGKTCMNENSGVINSKIGFDSYDLGHVYTLSCEVGGIAILSSMCTNIKGNGCTCYYRNDVDYMAARVTSHEIGHQMAASHTFNNCDAENESQSTGFEPGGGSTIMSYGGLCGNNSVTRLADDYYHSGSLLQIYTHLREGGTADGCSEKITTDNVEPVITLDYPNSFAIPTNTYFFLEGKASDANNDKLTYKWEQMNTGPLSPVGSPIGNAPNFVCYKPDEKAYRFFPKANSILTNTRSKFEVLPKNKKLMRFNFVVRDNHPTAGTAVWKEVKFSTIPDASGKQFGITNFESGAVLNPGDDTSITWEVANTKGGEIDCQSVDIYYYQGTSSDFHPNNWKLIAANVPNNGSHDFKVPNAIGSSTKFIVKASNNIFFDTNSGSIEIKAPESPSLELAYNNKTVQTCIPTSKQIEVPTYAYGDLSGDVELSIASELPEGVNYSFEKSSIPAGDTTLLTFTIDANVATQLLDVEIVGLISDVDTARTTYRLDIVNSNFSDITLSTPSPDATGTAVNTGFAWKGSPNASSYRLQVSKSAKFDGESMVVDIDDLTTLETSINTILDKSTVYFWRVIGKNKCGIDENPTIGVFVTEVLSCNNYNADKLPVSIPSAGKPKVEATFTLSSGGSVGDINVNNITLDHRNIKELTLSLVGPDNSKAVLISNKCEGRRKMKCSFDDQATRNANCNLNAGSIYKPKQPLSVFNGKSSQGTWKLLIEDNKSGSGGKLSNVVLEVCSNASLNGPELITNNPLKAQPSQKRRIGSELLASQDNDTDPQYIVYTVLSLPERGTLYKWGSPLTRGDIFTETDIRSGGLEYESGTEEYTDGFNFTVTDGAGGLVGVSLFQIDVNKDNPTSVQDAKLDGIRMYPNPTRSTIHIDVADHANIEEVEVYDMMGGLVAIYNINTSKNTIAVDLESGMYTFVVKNEKGTSAHKIAIVR